ncbi:hypothetical protein [Phyllobacterium chamaecytisi]|uniref:hypothetical protein n=1 Tax=Phyllobacterium chamaecytisi TaxID=2876082 RepID=UPI001CCF73DF|nr:hypothetical protein [Phyllobacterium sp. KW56]MBZ9600492.1 hypothetical protein [Phyllobacterium sp. KW56]
MNLMSYLFMYALDVALAGVAANFIHPPMPTFLFVLAILWLGPIVLGFWGFVKFWVFYHLYFKKRLVRAILADFYGSKFPVATEFFDMESYVEHISHSADVPEAAKMRASGAVGMVQAYQFTKPLTMKLAYMAAFEEAMNRYRPNEFLAEYRQPGTE